MTIGRIAISLKLVLALSLFSFTCAVATDASASIGFCEGIFDPKQSTLSANASEQSVSEIYNSIPISPDLYFDGISVTSKASPRSNHVEMTSKLFNGDRKKIGSVWRMYVPAERRLTLLIADLKRNANQTQVPRFFRLQGGSDEEPASDIPMTVFLTLHQMKLAGIQAGEVRTLEVDSVTNVRTGLELASHPEIRQWTRDHPTESVPASLLARHFLATQTGRYVDAILAHSGHRIKQINLSDIKQKSIHSQEVRVALTNAKIRALVDTFKKSESFPFGFRVEIELEPIGD